MSDSRPFFRRQVRKGLTLIELIVVLTILIALGSLLVPVIGNALVRSHVATCSSTIPEVNNMLQISLVDRGVVGDDWTTGVAGAGASAGAAVNGGLTVGNLTTDEVSAMNAVGVITVWNHGDPTSTPGGDPYNVTFNPGLASETLSDSTDVIVLTDEQAEGIFLPTDGDGTTAQSPVKYIWLGIDTTWSLLGTLTAEPPTHFGDTEGAFPDQAYSRFGAIFQVTDEDGNALEKAEVKRASYSLNGEGDFETADNHIGIFWQDVQN
ncbi:MAG: type II secretion system protein [Planctomycetota bacterium]